MEAENQPDNGTRKKKSRTYFALGTLFLLAMALSWSVDTSLVYIFLGFACFFLFLGFHNTPRPDGPKHEHRKAYPSEQQEEKKKTPFTEDLRNIFQKTSLNFPKSGAGPVNISRIVRLVMIGIFVFFIAPIIVSIIRGEDGSGSSIDYYTAGEQYYFTQQYDSASISYKRAIQADPENAQAILGYGNVLLVRNERDSAIMMFNRALEISPEYKEASYNKALVLYDQKKYSDGIAILLPLIEQNPDYYDAMLLLGDYYYIQKNYDAAMPLYENAYQNGGMRSRMLCHIMAYIYDTKGDYEKAIGLYQEALSYDSSVVDIYQRLGELIPGENGNFYRVKAVQMQQ